jgi:aldehyde:ferredoxin oxidoreductase
MVSRERTSNDNSNQILRVDLNRGKVSVEKIEKENLTKFFGGRGLGVKILIDEANPMVEPFSSENKLIFAVGPLTGTPVPTGCRYGVITKSPLTGTITSANAGGYFGTYLRRSGFLAIVIEGCSTQPVYLSILDRVGELRSAHEFWGANTHETTDWIISELDIKKSSVACIGPAGENLVRFASIINDKHRAAGRGGVGAVMGFKRLKAIAVDGNDKIILRDEKRFNEIVKKIKIQIKNKTVTKINLPEYGTAKILDSANNYKLLGTRNFQQNHFEHAKKINAEQLKKRLLIKRNTCSGCPIGCKRVTKVDGRIGEGPEFETLWSFGAQCGVKNLKAIAKANYLCNELGLDTISTGNTIGCAMELSEKGFIDEKLSFGDAKLIQKLTKQIAYRDGLGDQLAEGSYRFADSIGHSELSMSVKSLELPAYDPRGAQAQGLGYATSTRGACHVRAFVVKSDMVAGPQNTDPETINQKVKNVIKTQNKMAIIDSLGMCMFSSYVCDISDYRGLLDAAVGVEYKTDDDLLRAGECIWNLERVFNNKAGFTKADDTLPDRFKTEAVKDDLDYEHVWPERELIEEYYKERGWTDDGDPKKGKLKELGL